MNQAKDGRGALFAGGLAAILASTCCPGPLVLVALGFSGAQKLTQATENAGYPSSVKR